MGYSVKEIYYTLQGEGARSGRAAVFCRFAGCNLWSGREADRASAPCDFCDTDFVGTDGPGGGRFESPRELAEAISALWYEATGRRAARAHDADHNGRARANRATPYVVFTGGEPLLQLDRALLEACHALGFENAVETNGTIEPPAGVDWLTVSPKADAPLVVRAGNELKLVYPQSVDPERFAGLDFELFFLQPMDGPERAENTARAIEYCRRHPLWRLSLQAHKVVGIP